MATAQATKNAITLKGSAAIISEYLSMNLKIQQKLTEKFTFFAFYFNRLRHQFDSFSKRYLSS